MRIFLLALFLSAASISDLVKRKIGNRLILVSALIGGALSLHYGGFGSLFDGILTAAGIFVLFLPFFMAHLIGAGDIKLLMVIALFLGHGVLFDSLFPILVFSLVILLIFAILNRGFKGVRVPMAVPLSLGVLSTLVF